MSFAHETETGPRQGTSPAQLGTTCFGANGQTITCNDYRGNGFQDQHGFTGSRDTHGPGMMRGNNVVPCQGSGQVPVPCRENN